MKKTILGCFALLCSAWAWADDAFSIGDFTIAAGEEKTIDVMMSHDVDIAAFQFVLELPQGVSIEKVMATNRLKKWDDDESAYVPVHQIATHAGNGTYKVMAYAMPTTNIAGNSGDAVVKLKFKASDQISTGSFTLSITDQEMTEADGTKHKIDASTYQCDVTLSAKVTALGYASFSWPKALDFSASGVEAYIAKSCDGSSVTLEKVTKVPANTGLILKGVAGSENTYQLQTTDDATDDVSANRLTSTASGAYTIQASDNSIYVLSNLKDGQAGFYIADAGVEIGQYKAYLNYESTGSCGLKFNFSDNDVNSIQSIDTPGGHEVLYNLQGQRTTSPRQGIYIMGSKKVVIK